MYWSELNLGCKVGGCWMFEHELITLSHRRSESVCGKFMIDRFTFRIFHLNLNSTFCTIDINYNRWTLQLIARETLAHKIRNKICKISKETRFD